MSRFFGLLLLFPLGCHKAQVPSEPGEPARTPAATSAATAPGAASTSSALPRQTFGARLGTSAEAALADVLKSPDRFSAQTVMVEGEVRRACTRKGCWMELGEASDPATPGCRVTFKDYGFFVPTDSAGAKARVEAKVETKTIQPAMVRHLEEEGAKFTDKAPDGSAREVRLVATGVELWR